MILKASQRGGGKQLALHLMKTQDNEHVEVHEIRGFVSDDIIGALKEAYAVSLGTRCKQFLFSVSLNPPPNERAPVEAFEKAITRIEEKNNLTDQPRIIVFHEKEGRRHAHAVWSRIDADTMTARNLPHFKLKLRDLSREIYLENDWKMPRGLMNSREADPRNFNLKEWQQAKRIGRDPRDLKEIVLECWAVSDSPSAFAQALKARGMTLAKGDRRGHVAITPEGEVLSVARYTGKKTKEIEKRLGLADSLPSVADARSQLATDLSKNLTRIRREAEIQKQRDLAPLEDKRQSMVVLQRQERVQLRIKQEERWVRETRERLARFEPGVKGLWNRLIGKNAKIQKANEYEAFAGLTRDRDQREQLIQSHLTDRSALQLEFKSLRDRHAALLKDLRQDQKAVRQMAVQPEPVRDFPKAAERLKKLRTGQRSPKTGRDRDPDRSR